MSKLDQLRAQREAWFEGRKLVNEIPKAITLTSGNFVNEPPHPPPLKKPRRTKDEMPDSMANFVRPSASPEKVKGKGVSEPPKGRGRPPKPDGARKDMAAYMRARRAKKDG